MRQTWRYVGLAVLAGAEIALTAGPCARGGEDCASEPLEHLIVFVEGPDVPRVSEFSGGLTAVTDPNNDGFRWLVVREASGAERRVKVRAPVEVLPLVPGRSYAFHIEYVGGFPGASGLVVEDSAGIVLAGASDSRLGTHVFQEGVPGFQVQLVDGDCAGRAEKPCYDAVVNLKLQVGRAGDTLSLWNGESGTLDGYQVICLTAQSVDYNPDCADAGVPEVSFLVTRADSAASQEP